MAWHTLTSNVHVVSFPDEVVEKYMNSVSTVTFPAESTRDIAGLVDQHCKATENTTEALDAPHSGSDSYFFIKSKRDEDKDIFLCSAPRITSHQAMDYLQNMFDFSCGNGNFRQCMVPADYDIKVFSETVSAVFVRHPFDRLILEFKHKIHKELSAEDKNIQSSSNIKSRKILAYSRFKKWKKKQKKGSHKFRQFIKSNVLSSNSTILPISQVSSEGKVTIIMSNLTFYFTDLPSVLSLLRCVPEVRWWFVTNQWIVQLGKNITIITTIGQTGSKAQNIRTEVAEEVLLRNNSRRDGAASQQIL